GSLPRGVGGVPGAAGGGGPAESGEYPAQPGEGARVQVGAGSEILSGGRATRVGPAALRKALVLRDRHRQFPGCGGPARWADAHHLEHWIEGGKTCSATSPSCAGAAIGPFMKADGGCFATPAA